MIAMLAITDNFVLVNSLEMGKTGTGDTHHFYEEPKKENKQEKLMKNPYNIPVCKLILQCSK